MEDDLEYYINFPVPDQRIELDKAPVSSNIVHHGNQTVDFYKNLKNLKLEPVIFLLGWLGAQDRHLAKYSSMYNNLGCITIRYTAPIGHLFLSPDKKLLPIAEKLIKLLEETSLSMHPIIFHSFSNHGSTLYSYISKTLQTNPDLSLEIRGCIFDSTPSPRRLSSAFRALYRSLTGPFWLRLMASSALCFYLCCSGIFKLFSCLLTGHWPISHPWSLLQEPFRWPQLFLYSEADDLIPFKYVQKFASERKALGVDVRMHKFENSSHVCHYRVHPEEYTGAVNQFINFCLSQEKEDLELQTNTETKKKN